jgi:DNA-binding GntR family transcriptional regulator
MASDVAPRYRQVADALQRGIAKGELASHDRLASERVIADRYGLSRMTARQAVELLVRRGVVYRRPGSGTYVAPPRIPHTLKRLAGFSEQMRRQGITPGGRVLEMRCTARFDPVAREALRLPPHERAWMLRRLRFGDGEPLLLETFWVPRSVCSRLSRHELAEGSLYAVMRDRYGVEPVSARTSLEPAALDAADARHLGARPGGPAILFTRTTFDAGGRPVEFARDLYRGDRARFELDLRA